MTETKTEMTETAKARDEFVKIMTDLFNAAETLSTKLAAVEKDAERDRTALRLGRRPFGIGDQSMFDIVRAQERFSRALELASWGTDLSSEEITEVVRLGADEERGSFWSWIREAVEANGWTKEV